MRKHGGDALAMADAALREVDDVLRGASQVRLRAAVDRLLESAAQDCEGGWHHGESWTPDGLEYDEWQGSIEGSNIGAYRLCDGDCYDSEVGRWLACTEHQAQRDDAGLWCMTPWVPPPTRNNLDVLRRPPDGVEGRRPSRSYADLARRMEELARRLEAMGAVARATWGEPQ